MEQKLKSIQSQLNDALEENHKKRSDKNLMHDWIFDSLRLITEIIDPSTITVKCKYTHSCGLFPCNLSECPEFEQDEA